VPPRYLVGRPWAQWNAEGFQERGISTDVSIFGDFLLANPSHRKVGNLESMEER